MAASQMATSSAWSWVITSRWVPGGSSASTSSGSTGTWWTCTAATRVGQRRERVVGEVLRPRVDEVEVEVVAGQDPRQLEADVADPEDRHAGHHGQRLEQHRHLAAAALHAMLVSGALSDRWLSKLSGRRPPLSSSARARRTASASRLPPPTEPQVRRAETTIFAPASRGAWPRTSVTVTSTPGSRVSSGATRPPATRCVIPGLAERTRSSAQ